MTSEAVAFPFYRPPADSVVPQPWFYETKPDSGQGSQPLEAAVPSWDYNVDLILSRSIQVDVPGILKACRLDAGTILRITVLLSTAGQRIRRKVLSSDLVCEASMVSLERELGFELMGEAVQGDLRIDTEITVHEACSGADADEFVPTVPGARLWSDTVTAALEGSLSRFPMTAVKFGDAFGEVAHAAWMLQWAPDALELNAASALRLYLNEDADVFEELVACETPLCGIMLADVLRQVLVTVLGDADYRPAPDDWPEYSLGRLAGEWLNAIFPEIPVDVLRARLQSDPGWVESRVQSFVRSDNAG